MAGTREQLSLNKSLQIAQEGRAFYLSNSFTAPFFQWLSCGAFVSRPVNGLVAAFRPIAIRHHIRHAPPQRNQHQPPPRHPRGPRSPRSPRSPRAQRATRTARATHCMVGAVRRDDVASAEKRFSLRLHAVYVRWQRAAVVIGARASGAANGSARSTRRWQRAWRQLADGVAARSACAIHDPPPAFPLARSTHVASRLRLSLRSCFPPLTLRCSRFANLSPPSTTAAVRRNSLKRPASPTTSLLHPHHTTSPIATH